MPAIAPEDRNAAYASREVDGEFSRLGVVSLNNGPQTKAKILVGGNFSSVQITSAYTCVKRAQLR